MADFPAPVWPPLNVISPFSQESRGGHGLNRLTGLATGAPVTADRASYVHFALSAAATPASMGILPSNNTGNVDVGIYDAVGNRVWNSGTTALGTVDVLQTITYTGPALPASLYWMAIQFSSSSATMWGATVQTAPGGQWGQMIQNVGSFGLPATATMVVDANSFPPTYAMGVFF